MSETPGVPSKGESKWQFIERSAAALEHMLAPDSTVLHNQTLREWVSGLPRQCDAVVWYGTAPRRTLAAIVEVQDRGSKVGLQDFEAWCAKRENLGAQRLICVSCEGYTKDVEISARSKGDIVTLMTLCEQDQRPSFLAATGFVSHMQILHYRDARVTYHERLPARAGTVEEKSFEFPGGGKKVSLDDLASFALKKGLARDTQRRPVDNQFHDLTYRLEFGAAGKPLLLKEGDQTYSVWEVQITDRIETVSQGLETVPLAYEQKNIDGALVYVLFGKGSYQGREFYTQQPFKVLSSGRIQPGPGTMSKMEGHKKAEMFTEFLVSVSIGETPKENRK
jgi:hypothetical protein